MSDAPRARARRLRSGAMAAIIALSMTASAVLATLIASRYAVRLDATATGEFELSPRTVAVLAGLEGDWEIVVAADPRWGDPEARQRVRDTLAELRRRAPSLRTTWLDLDSDAGRREHAALLLRLRERDAGIDAQVATIRSAVDGLEEAGAYFGGALTDALRRAAAGASGPGADEENLRRFLAGNADAARAESARLGEAVRAARGALDAVGEGQIPPTDELARVLAGHLRPMTRAVATLAAELAALGDLETASPALRDAVAAPAAELASRRDRLAVLLDSVERLRPTDLVRARRLIESAGAAVVIGPTGLAAVDGEHLLPSTAAIEATTGLRTDLGRRAEELLSTAIASVAEPRRPVVVVVHGEATRFALESPLFRDALDRLSFRGIDLLEWAAAVEDQPPSPPRTQDGLDRPVVYVVHGTDTSAGGGGDPGLAGPARAARLGAAVKRLLDDGRSALVSIGPSTLPAIGQPDPAAAPLADLGIRADTGRPIIREAAGANGAPVIGRAYDGRIHGGPHALSAALAGLPTLLPWPIALRVSPTPGVGCTPLFVESDPAAWGESQWLTLWQMPGEQPARAPNAPSPDPSRDATDRPWTIALAVEREGERPQRLVVVGSNGWFARGITSAAQQQVDGRIVTRYPGNLELLEAAVYWLAGQDRMIAPSPSARAVPRVRPLSERELAAARWVVVGALPLLTLGAGLIWRMLRG